MKSFFYEDGPEHFLEKEITEYAAELLKKGEQIRAEIEKTQDVILAQSLRKKYLQVVKSAFPQELFTRATSPVAVLVSRFEEKEFYIENYCVNALYGREVNLSLFIPKNEREKHKPVVMPTGHSAKTGSSYQGIAQFFAKNGYMVALFDSIGQGELQYNNDHFICGVTGYLVDVWSQTHFVGDTLCVMDYLQMREDVDTAQGFGMTGVSGGGTTTLFCAMLDDRVTAIAPSCCISPHKEIHVKDLYTTCPECFGKGYIQAGLDVVDYIWLAAPKPVLVLCGKQDTVFDVEATLWAYQEAHKVYDVLGEAENLRFFADDCPHSYSVPMAAKAVVFFDEFFGKATGEKNIIDTVLPLLDAKMISSYPNTHINMYEINKGFAAEYAEKRRSKSSAKDVAERLAALLGFAPEGIEKPTGRVVQALPVRLERSIQKIVLQDSSHIQTPGLLVRNDKQEKPHCLIFADDKGKFAGFKKGGFLSQVLAVTKSKDTSTAVLSMELAGYGELKCESTPYDTVFWNDIERILSYLAVANGRPIPYYWVKSLLQAKAYVDSTGQFSSEFYLGGRGESAVGALFAAVLAKQCGYTVKKLVLMDMLADYRCMTEVMPYVQSELLLVPDILRELELADLLEALQGCEILLLNPKDGNNETISPNLAKKMYKNSGLNNLTVVCCENKQKIKDYVGGLFE